VTASQSVASIKSGIEQVTPELAEEWLGRNSHNRPLRNNRVAELAGAMKRGEWTLNGDAIRWSRDGVLLDGQHRLWAVVESGVSITTVVIRGLDESVQETMDTGARRSLKDTLVLRGESGGSKLAAIITYKWRLDNGHVRMASVRPSIAQGISTLEQHPALRDAGRMADRLRQRFPMSQAMAAVVYYEFATIDQDDADVFWSKLVDGVELKEHDPIFVLRRYLERQAMQGTAARSGALTVHALMNKAWNAWRDGQEVDGLSWKASGMKAEAFPLPR
jgi:hypothetical protein